jgi:hypothetical protein
MILNGQLTDGSLSWSIEGIGFVGTGNQFTLYDLDPGFYRATLTATDSNGQSSSDTIGFMVGHHVFLPLVIK